MPFLNHGQMTQIGIQIVFVCLVAFSGAWTDVSAQKVHSLKVEIHGLRSERGKLFFQLFDEQKNVVREAIVDIKGSPMVLNFDQIKQGQYAFRYYHDENNNQKLDRNLLGVPREGFGFSNDPPLIVGEPSFDKWLFPAHKDVTQISTIRYF